MENVLLLPTAVGTEVSTKRVIQLQPARRYRPVRTADSTPACTRSTSVARRGTVIDPPAVPIKKRMEKNLSILLIGGHLRLMFRLLTWTTIRMEVLAPDFYRLDSFILL
jgi:hypothetical protein